MGLVHTVVLPLSAELLQQNTRDLIAQKASTGRPQDYGLVIPLFGLVGGISLYPPMAENKALQSFLKRALIPFIKVLLSRSNHHHQTPTSHFHCTGISIWTWRFWGDITSRRWQGRTSEKYAVTFQTPGNNTACLASLIRYWVSSPWWVSLHAVCMARPSQVMWRYLASDGGLDTVQAAGLQEQGRNK